MVGSQQQDAVPTHEPLTLPCAGLAMTLQTLLLLGHKSKPSRRHCIFSLCRTLKKFGIVQNLLDISAPKKKKKTSPPLAIPQFAADTLPAPQPLPFLETTLVGFTVKSRPPPPSWRLELPLPPPRAEKKIFETSTKKRCSPPNLEAQQRYFSYRAILVAIVSQNPFVLVFMRYRTIIARYVAKRGIAQMWLCETKCQGGGIAPCWGSANLPKKVSRDIATIVSQYCAIWGH